MIFTKLKTSFHGTKAATSAKNANLAIFGAPHGTPYKTIDNRVHQKAPNAFRKAMAFDAGWAHHWDFDFDGRIVPNDTFKAVDLGDLKTKSKDGKGNRKLITTATKHIRDAGAKPIMFGGDDSVPIPFLEGFAGTPITLIQLDAHIDWRDERDSERQGFSNTMRRASKMEHVKHMLQVGIRGLGSARKGEVEDAKAWGSRIITARNVQDQGIHQVLSYVERGSNCVICMDLDVLDIALMPAVAAPSPGGLSFHHVTDLIAGVSAKANLIGFSMVEFVPARDMTGACAYTAGRIAAHVIASMARA
jgi:agmatinase